MQIATVKSCFCKAGVSSVGTSTGRLRKSKRSKRQQNSEGLCPLLPLYFQCNFQAERQRSVFYMSEAARKGRSRERTLPALALISP